MARVLLMTIVTALADLAALIAFAAFLIAGHVDKAMLVAIAGAVWHGLFAPTPEQAKELAEFLQALRK